MSIPTLDETFRLFRKYSKEGSKTEPETLEKQFIQKVMLVIQRSIKRINEKNEQSNDRIKELIKDLTEIISSIEEENNIGINTLKEVSYKVNESVTILKDEVEKQKKKLRDQKALKEQSKKVLQKKIKLLQEEPVKSPFEDIIYQAEEMLSKKTGNIEPIKTGPTNFEEFNEAMENECIRKLYNS